MQVSEQRCIYRNRAKPIIAVQPSSRQGWDLSTRLIPLCAWQMSSFLRQWEQEQCEQQRSGHELTFPGSHPLAVRNQPSRSPCCCRQPHASKPARPCSRFIILIKLCKPGAVRTGFMPLVFALGSGGDTLSVAFGCRGGALHTVVLVGHRRVPGSSAEVPVPDSCGVTQPAGAHGAGRMGSLRAQVWLLWVRSKQCWWQSHTLVWGNVMAEGWPQDPLARQGRGLPLLGSLQRLRSRALPQVHTEPGKKSGFCKQAQHHAKLLNVPLQGDVEVECGIALVQPGVML